MYGLLSRCVQDSSLRMRVSLSMVGIFTSMTAVKAVFLYLVISMFFTVPITHTSPYCMYIMLLSVDTTTMDGRCREASIAHFQGWKRNYFHFSARLPTVNSNSLLVSESGIIPLVVCGPDMLNPPGVYCALHPTLPRMVDVYGGGMWASYYLSWRDVEEATIDTWKVARRRKDEQKQIQLRWKQFHSDVSATTTSDSKLSANIINIGKLFMNLPTASNNENATSLRGSGSISLRSSVTQSLTHQQPSPQLNALSYCAGFSKDLRRCTCRLYRSEVSIVSIGKPIATRIRGAQNLKTSTSYLRQENSSSSFSSAVGYDSKRVTLITAAWVREYNGGMLDSMLSSWGGPKVSSKLTNRRHRDDGSNRLLLNHLLGCNTPGGTLRRSGGPRSVCVSS